MSRIPPELDRLMWTLAEESNDRAIEEFVARFPAHRAELMHRTSMVRGLRGAKAGLVRKDVPRFAPQPNLPSQTTRPLAFATAVLVLAAFGLASYAWISAKESRSSVTPVAENRRVDAPLVVPNPESFVKRSNGLPNPIVRDNVIGTNPLPSPGGQPIAPPSGPQAPEPAYLKPKDVTISDTALQTAIALVTDGSGLRVEFAPGFPDQEVSLSYVGKDTVEILRDLSQKYGFTIFDEGEGRVLLVPAVEPAGPSRRAGP